MQSSDAEKQEVIDLWKLIRKFLKRKQTRDDMVRDVLEEQRNSSMENR